MPWPAGNGGGLSGLAARLTGVEVAIGIETAAFIALIAGSGGLTAGVVRGRSRSVEAVREFNVGIAGAAS